MEVPSSVVHRYLTRRQAEVEKCLLAFKAEDFEPALKLGHQLKGNGVTFGFPELSRMGSVLEQAAVENNKAKMETSMLEISTWINHQLSSSSSL